MFDAGKRNVLGVEVDALDCEAAVARVLNAATKRRPYSCTALAVHGLMTGVLDQEQKFRLNALDLVTPDGQPVRWALNSIHRTRLTGPVTGSALMIGICEAAAASGVPIYIYGSAGSTISPLSRNLQDRFPELVIAGAEPSQFRPFTPAERESFYARVRDSGAGLLFVGLGCPRQEVFAFECTERLGMPVISVGAAFDFHAGVLTRPSPAIQRMGLEWAARLLQEPGRLWKRYLAYNPLFLGLFALQRLGIWRPRPVGKPPSQELMYG